jgi:hypothetical protein
MNDMHKNFGEWYRLVSIEPTDALLRTRWAGVEEWVSTICSDDKAILETVRIFRGLPMKTSRDNFLAAFREKDAAFGQRNNELEQRVLAGATLVQCVLAGLDTTKNKIEHFRSATIAGASVVASTLQEPDHLLDEIIGEIKTNLHELARQQRKRISINTTLLGSKEEGELTKTLDLVTNAPDHVQLRTHVSAMFQTFLKILPRSKKSFESADYLIRRVDEETNILWWLVGEHSRYLNRSWKSLENAAPLLAGTELADLTEVALGPQDAAAILECIINKAKAKEQSLHVFVDAVPEEWAKAHLAEWDEVAIDLTPLSLALMCRAKSDTSTWQPFFEKNCGLEASIKLEAELVAQLAYAEAVLFSTLAQAES